ncbi:MAG: DUF945 family protein [Thalassotalea sp.]
MKKIGIAAVVVVAGACIAPAFIGSMVEAKYQESIDQMLEHPSIEIVESQFTKTWFSGTSIIKLKLRGDLAELEQFEFVVKDDIQFGPVIWGDNGLSFNLATSTSTITFDEGLISEEFVQVLNEKLAINSKITYGLDYVTSVSLGEISKEQDGNTFRIGALNGEFAISNDKFVVGQVDWQGADFKGPKANVLVSSASMTFDQELVSGDLYSGNAVMVGKGALMVSQIVAKTPTDEEIFSLTDLAIAGESSVENNLLDLTLNYGAKEIKAEQQVFNNANLNIIFKKLDAEILAELNTLFAKMPQDGDQQAVALHTQKIAMVATKLLVNNPEISVSDLSVETSAGKIKSDMLVSIDNQLYDPANPMSLLGALKADAKGNAPEPFFEQFGLKPMLDMYVEQGLLVRENTDLSFKVQFEQGKLTVNGQIMPL